MTEQLANLRRAQAVRHIVKYSSDSGGAAKFASPQLCCVCCKSKIAHLQHLPNCCEQACATTCRMHEQSARLLNNRWRRQNGHGYVCWIELELHKQPVVWRLGVRATPTPVVTASMVCGNA